MDQPNEQELAMLEQAGMLEEFVKTKGWEFIKHYIENSIQQFANKAIMGEGFKDMEEYQFYRGEVSGLRSLLIEIESSLQNLNKYREQHRQ